MQRSIIPVVILIFVSVTLAQRHHAESTASSTEPSTAPSDHPQDKLSVTHHSITINGATINYDATAGTISTKDEQGKPLADFFFVAYVKQPVGQPTTRPITFIFNGGPGAAAVWLHLGAAGPYRVKLGDDGIPGPPPHSLIVNDQTWLDLSDLVFIDPVGTGFSRPAPGQKGDEFYGVQQDLDSVGDFIRLYLTRYERWDSPKFLAGESYGTTRAAGLSAHLMERYGIDLNGIILISSVLNLQTLSPSNGNDLPYALYLPTYTSIALYHKKLTSADPDKLRDEVGRYALGDYLTALAQGSGLSQPARADVIDHLARFTGLPADLIDKANLRIDPTFFRKQLLNDQRLILGRFDARITGEDPDPTDQDADYDPSLSLYLPVYSTTFNDYVRRELNFESDLPYEVLNGRIGPWDFGKGGMGYLDVTHWLREAMLDNPHLRVMVAAGYDDLATPFLAADYTFDHLDPTGRLRNNVTQTFYPSGHMIYHDPASLLKLRADIGAFMNGAK